MHTVIHGIGVPIQYTDPNIWAAQYPEIPFVTWRSSDCHHANNIPLVWRSELPEENCNDGRPLLLFNEPHSKGQSNLTPRQAADFAMQHQDWEGPIYCCGAFWDDNGWEWFQEFVALYEGRLDGIHIHTYIWWDYNQGLRGWGERWRELANLNEWSIIISEWSALGIDKHNAVQRNTEVLPMLEEMLQPSMMFYFSWFYQLTNSDLTNGKGNLTPMGKWWMSMTPRLWLPKITQQKGLR